MFELSQKAQNLTLDLNAGEPALPWPAPYASVMNGQAGLKALGDARFFGGWQIDAQSFDEAVQDWGVSQALVEAADFKCVEMENRGGGEYSCYISRHLVFVPLVGRRAFRDRQNARVRYANYRPGTISHVQYLAMLMVKTKDGLHPLFPVTLSAKSYSAAHLQKALKTWADALNPVRRAHAPHVPFNYFACSIGTWGSTRRQILVGKGAQSPITPVAPYIPQEITVDILQRLFVGSELADRLVDIVQQAHDSGWVDAWKTDSATADSTTPYEGENDGGYDNGHTGFEL